MSSFLNKELLNWSSPETTITSKELLRLEEEIQRLRTSNNKLKKDIQRLRTSNDSKLKEWFNITSIKPTIYDELLMYINPLINKNNINSTHLDIIINKVNNSIQIKEGNFIQHIFEDEKIQNFLLDIGNLTPKGLCNSPNAACGKFELLVLLLNKHSKKISRGYGDIELDGNKIEIKGKDARVSNPELTGKRYKENMDEVCKKWKIKPNTVFRSKKLAFEPEKERYRKHYEKQFEGINYNFFIDIFKAMYLNIEKNEIKYFYNGKWDYKKYVETIVMKLGEKTIPNDCEFWIFGDGTNLKISKNVNEFKAKINSGELIICKDYFRINQNYKIGWYIE